MSTHTIAVVAVPCPFCSHLQEFADPPEIRSTVCAGCNLYVVESEWHGEFMRRVGVDLGEIAAYVERSTA